MIANNRRVCALIPAYTDAVRIGRTIDALRSRSEIDRIVVIDDGSTDGTSEISSAAGAEVVRQRNGGKGSALTAGYGKARGDADIYLLLDADLTSSATEFVKLLEPVANGEADMTIGILPPDPAFEASGESGGLGLAVRLARRGIEKRSGTAFKQPLSGQRAVTGAVLESLGGVFAPGFGVEVDLTVRTLLAGYRVVEVDTNFRHKVTGSDLRGILHRARQLIDIWIALARAKPAKTPGPSDVPKRA